jgi:DMSO/TMAO reductase YedYZ molybdopterin-dependent catalytic subunit
VLRGGLQATVALAAARPLAELGRLARLAAGRDPWNAAIAGSQGVAAAAEFAVQDASPNAPRKTEAGGQSTADQLIAGKDRRLLVHNPARTGFEIETPLELLREDAVTPAAKLFVRNNQQPDWAATLAAAPAGPWRLEVGGLLEFPRVVTLEELKTLPLVEQELVLQCSGNGRAMFSAVSPVKGSQWSYGAMGNVRFKGVSLKSVFEKFEIRPHVSARFLTAEGADSPGKPGAADFEHSLPLEETLSRAILAFEMNGEPLPAVHGGPLRLVTPGYYGTMHVKWLARLRLEAQESVNHHQVKRYRTPRELIEPGKPFDYRIENSDAHWRMKIKSVFFSPVHSTSTKGPRVLASGVAWNDGTALIDAVELSSDGGQTWRRAELQRAGRYAWQRWQATLALPAGSHTLICRAIDTLGNSQPLDGAIAWNPDGYVWNGADRVTVQVEA